MNLKKQIFSYAFINMINASVPFMLLPILTKYLEPSDYGILSLIQLLMMISLPLVLFNTHGLLTIEYSKMQNDEFKIFLSTIVWIPIFGFFILESLFLVCKNQIIEYFHIPSEYILYIPFIVLFQAIPTIVPLVFQAKKDPVSFGKYKISMSVLNLLLSMLFVIVLLYSWEGRVLGIAFSFAIFTVIGIIVLLRLDLLKMAFDIDYLKDALKFGIPLIPHTIAGIFLSMSDRVFLSNMLGTYEVGIYSVAFQVSSIVLIVMSSINQAWAPNLYEKLNNNPTDTDKVHLVKTTYKIMGIMLGVVVVFIFFSSFIFDIFIDKSYHEAKNISIYIAIAFLFQGFYFMFTNYIFYSKKTKILSYITLTSVLFVCIFNYMFIQFFGIVGSAYALILVWIVQFFIISFVSNKVYSMPWRLL
jgi:O-antigen/teichoic acid export membrane protein